MSGDVDLSRASFVQIQVGVLECERGTLGDNSREWPDAIRRLIERELAGWRRRNPTRAIVGATRSFSIEGQCSIEFHHVDKSELERAPALPLHAPAAPTSPACNRCGE